MLTTDQDSNAVLAGLDEYQVRAVTAPVGLVVVKAGAGSGKTTVLARRIAHRIATETADAQHTLAFTFTRQAGAELTHRIASLGVSRDVTTGTFHAVAYSILRLRWADTGKQPRNVISSRAQILARIVPGARTDTLAQVSQEIDWARARMIDPINYASSAAEAGRRPPLPPGEFEKILNAYEQEKRKRGVVDLDDLIALTISDMTTDRKFAAQLGWRFRHIHVDEAQDMNPLQYAFVRALANGRNDLFFVGDPCQAIYGWNGADHRNFDSLAEQTAGTYLITLPNNYRCSPTIVDAASHVLRANGMEVETVAKAMSGPPVRLHTSNTVEQEARLIADVLRMPATTYGDQSSAVLVRTNAQIEPIRKALVDAGLSVRTSNFGGSAVAEAMRTVASCDSTESLLAWADDMRETTATSVLPELVAEYIVQSSTSDVSGSGFSAWVNATGALRDTSRGGSGDDIEVLTFHASKGRQWNRVVIAGCEKGFVPHSSAITTEQLAEEARLLYVAMTRAENELHISRCLSRNNRNCQPSPWLKGMPIGEAVPPASPPPELRETLDRMRSTDSDLTKALVHWRRETARIGCTTESAVCTDDELKRIATTRPQSEGELAALLGPMMARRHAAKILAITRGEQSKD